MSQFPFSPLSALKPLAGRALELALNQALTLDAETRTELATLDGRTLTLALDSPPLALQLTVEGERLRVGKVEADTEPDLAIRSTLTGALSQLGRMIGTTPSDEDSIGQIKVAGDAGLARQLQRLATRFDPDWQRPFVSVFGDVIGVQIANALASALRQTRAASHALRESTTDFLTEEAQLLVSRAELDAFHTEIDTLREDTDHLAARISRLAATRAPA